MGRENVPRSDGVRSILSPVGIFPPLIFPRLASDVAVQHQTEGGILSSESRIDQQKYGKSQLRGIWKGFIFLCPINFCRSLILGVTQLKFKALICIEILLFGA